MKHLTVKTEDGAVIRYEYETVEQLKRVLPDSLVKIGRNVQLGDYLRLGEDIVIGDGCIIDDDVEIGDGVILDSDVHLGAWATVDSDVWISEGTYIAPATDVTEDVQAE